MSVQIIEKDGKPDYAILPYDEYLELITRLENKEDVEAVQAFRSSGEETFPHSVMDELISGISPVKVFRKYRGLTQAALAREIGKSNVYITKLESGERKGTTEVMRAIADALHVEIDLLI